MASRLTVVTSTLAYLPLPSRRWNSTGTHFVENEGKPERKLLKKEGNLAKVLSLY